MEQISVWARSIVISVILAIMIEMILPENNSKKYIKIIVGIFIVYSIISPIFEFFSSISVDRLIDKGEAAIEVSSSSMNSGENKSDYTENAIRNLYSQNLENEISNTLRNNGYLSEKIELRIASDETYNINQINIKIKEKVENKNGDDKQAQSIVETVKQIVINKNGKSNCEVISENDKSNIKKIIHSSFGVDEKNIVVN